MLRWAQVEEVFGDRREILRFAQDDGIGGLRFSQDEGKREHRRAPFAALSSLCSEYTILPTQKKRAACDIWSLGAATNGLT